MGTEETLWILDCGGNQEARITMNGRPPTGIKEGTRVMLTIDPRGPNEVTAWVVITQIGPDDCVYAEVLGDEAQTLH